MYDKYYHFGELKAISELSALTLFFRYMVTEKKYNYKDCK